MTRQETDNYLTLSNELLTLAATPAGGYTRVQLTAIGIPWPPPKGWKRAVIGNKISRAAFEILMQDSGSRGKA